MRRGPQFPNNQPVIGATVTVKGTNVATQTDANGNFSIGVPSGRNALNVSSVGFEAQDVNVSNQNSKPFLTGSDIYLE